MRSVCPEIEISDVLSQKEPTPACCLTELPFTFGIIWAESNFNLIYKHKPSAPTSYNMDSEVLFIYLFIISKAGIL